MNARRSKKVALRFFDTGVQFGAEHEPIEPPAGGSSLLKPVQHHELAECSPSNAALTQTDERRRTVEEREREIVTLAKAHILTCGDFLTVQDLANHLGTDVRLLSPALKAWEADHRIFSIEQDGCEYFPIYALPPQGGASPVAGLRDVLAILSPMKNSWGVSFWFVSPNGLLGGKRPKDLLANKPSLVISAALDEACGVMHG